MQHEYFTIEMAKGIIHAHMLGEYLSIKNQPMEN